MSILKNCNWFDKKTIRKKKGKEIKFQASSQSQDCYYILQTLENCNMIVYFHRKTKITNMEKLNIPQIFIINFPPHNPLFQFCVFQCLNSYPSRNHFFHTCRVLIFLTTMSVNGGVSLSFILQVVGGSAVTSTSYMLRKWSLKMWY